MNPALRMAALATVLLARGAWAAMPIRIELRPEVEVEEAQITLGDVATVTSRDAQAQARLESMPLGRITRGDGARLERMALARWIRARTGMDLAQIGWTGSAESHIRLAKAVVQGPVLARKAEEGLRAAAEQNGVRAEVALVQTPRDLPVPVAALELKVRPVSREDVLARRATVWVEAWAGGRFVQAVPVQFDVTAYAPGYVATEEQPAGKVLAPSEVAVREVEVTGRDPLPVGTASVENLRLRRPVAAGATLTRAQVEPAPLVSRGGFATLRSSQGLVQLESRVEVLEDGRSGQTIHVKMPNSTGPILARVTGPGSLEAQP